MPLPEKILPSKLQHHIDTGAMRQQLLDQIIKDLGIEPWPISAEAPDFFNLLEKELYYTLLAIIERQPQLLPNIIYRIDLNEQRVKTMLLNPEGDATKDLTLLVLEREMKKVFYRNVYSGKIVL
jgi:hypothetical protein